MMPLKAAPAATALIKDAMNASKTPEKKPFSRIGLIAKSGDNRLSETLTAIYALLRKKRLVVMPEHSTGELVGGIKTCSLTQLAEKADLVLVGSSAATALIKDAMNASSRLVGGIPKKKPFSRIGLVAKSGDNRLSETLTAIYALLRKKRLVVMPEHSTSELVGGIKTCSLTQLAEKADLVLIVSGDGVILHTARALVDRKIPIVGINHGRLGFLASIASDDAIKELKAIFEGRYIEESRALLKARVLRDGQEIDSLLAVNEVVYRSAQPMNLMSVSTFIDGFYVTTQAADGVLVATPTGSTAYSLSNGGPILQGRVEALLLQNISPHSLSSRPMVIDRDSVIRFRLSDSRTQACLLIADGQQILELEANDQVEIRAFAEGLHLVHPASYNYYRGLQEKLGWK